MFLSSNFLGIPEDEHTLEKSRVVVLPVPYERTVSYGVGTKNGILRRLATSRRIVGADVVEHSPVPGNPRLHDRQALLQAAGLCPLPQKAREPVLSPE